MMRKPVIIFVPGILNMPSSGNAWTDKAVAWVHNHTPDFAAEKHEYMALPVTRPLVAKALAEIVARYPQDHFRLVLVGHSFGAEVIRKAIQLGLCAEWPYMARMVDVVHLVAPAVAFAAKKNRLAKMVADGTIGALHLHIAGRDKVLSTGYLGGAPLAQIQKQFAGLATINFEPSYGHSTWWTRQKFDDSMEIFTGEAKP